MADALRRGIRARPNHLLHRPQRETPPLWISGPGRVADRDLRPDVPRNSKTGFSGGVRLHEQPLAAVGWVQSRAVLNSESIPQRICEQRESTGKLVWPR